MGRSSRSPSSSLEKSPVDKAEYEGLQLDTRIRRDLKAAEEFARETVFDHEHVRGHPRRLEDQWSPAMGQEASPGPLNSGGMGLPPLSHKKFMRPVQPQHDQNSRDEHYIPTICGLRKRYFWVALGLFSSLVITAIVIGAVVGSLKAKNVSDPQPWTYPSKNATGTPPYSLADVQAVSPLEVISYDAGNGGQGGSSQVFRLYYQSISGAVSEAVSQDSIWQTARPILTDALNYTGLAAVGYMNGTKTQGSIFYVNSYGLLAEKRKYDLGSENWWLPGTLNALKVPMIGNITLPGPNYDLPNKIDSFRMAAVYSDKFKAGPGIRLFFHTEDLNGTSWVQEAIWVQSQDKWYPGNQITGAWPNSHIGATIDETTNILRLFFSAGNNTLAEVWSDITQYPMTYQPGHVRVPGLLAHNYADLAPVSYNGSTSLFYYANTTSASTTGSVGIRELMITGMPNGTGTNAESFNINNPLVGSPDIKIGWTGLQFPYIPIAAAITAVSGLSPQVWAFWAQDITGNPLAISGYSQIRQTMRALSTFVWPTQAPAQIPLGSVD